MVNLLISTALLWIILVAVYHMVNTAGIPMTLPNKKLNSYLQLPPTVTETPSAREYFLLAAEALAFRILLYIGSAVLLVLLDNSGEALTIANFLDKWQRWDASNYIRIATGGYSYWIENGEPTTLVFLPLYAWLIKLVELVIRNYQVSALLISTVSYTIGTLYMFGFVAAEYGKKTAYRSVLYLSIFPFGFFFGAMMPESIFFLMTAAFFYYLRKHNWLMVALLGICASLTRLQGILLIVPGVIEWIFYYKPLEKIKQKHWKDLFSSLLRLLPISSSLLGTGIYLLINYKIAGNCFKFLELQEKVWTHQYQYIGSAISGIFDYLFGEVDLMQKVAIWIPEAVIVLFTILVLLYGVNKHKPQYTLYLTAYTIVSFSASFIISGGRYMSVAIPLFIIISKFMNNRDRLHRFYVAFSLFFLVLFLSGYVLGKPIM